MLGWSLEGRCTCLMFKVEFHITNVFISASNKSSEDLDWRKATVERTACDPKHLFIGACPKLRKATTVCPSVHVEQVGCHCTYFHETWYLRIFRKSVEKSQVLWKSEKNNGCFTWRLCTYIPRCIVLEWETFRRKSKRTFYIHNFSQKSFRLWDNIENYGKPDRPQMTM